MNYLKNELLLQQLKLSHEINKPTELLGTSFLLLVKRIATKPNWKGYPLQVKDELVSNAVCDLVNSWYKFDETKSKNPFAYFTSIVNNSFRRTINKEKGHMRFCTMMFQASEHTDYDSYHDNIGDGEGFERWITGPKTNCHTEEEGEE